MVVWRKGPKKPARPYVAPPEVELPPVSHAVEDGLLIAKSWASLEVKNWIVVRALRDGADYDPEATAAAVRAELDRMAAEQEGYAERVGEERQAAFQKRGNAKHQHDYRAGDLSALSRRRSVYAGLADALVDARNNDEFVAELAETARERAWEDIARALEANLDRVAAEPVVDESYRRARAQRLRWLRDIDLARLIEDHVAEEKAARKAERSDKKSEKQRDKKSGQNPDAGASVNADPAGADAVDESAGKPVDRQAGRGAAR